MAAVLFTIKMNRDNTVTVKRGRSVEHFSTNDKSDYDLVDAIRWSLVAMGGYFSWDEVHDLLLEEKKKL